MRILDTAVAALALTSGAKAASQYKVQTPPLDTDWTYDLGTDPWPEHPRPLLKRKSWKSLNGIWNWQKADSNDTPEDAPDDTDFEHEVLVPSCIESGISGLQVLDVDRMWYSTKFEVPEEWKGEKTLLHFEAVDFYVTIWVNGEKFEQQSSGYNRITLDVTDAVKEGENDLVVYVFDPTDDEKYMIPVGKQTRTPSHIFYRKCSGIWQQVWIENAPKDYIKQFDVSADMGGKVTIKAHSSSGDGASVSVKVLDKDDKKVGSGNGSADEEFTFSVDSPSLWSPDSPNLYKLSVSLGDDAFSSYTGFRTISQGKVDGVLRPLVNGEFMFWFGTLDQGYWPDGLYTPPNREAMVYDLEMLKDLGFNMVRKHIKVEPDLFYEACDKLGLLVVQDMPSMNPDADINDEQQEEFQRLLEVMVEDHKSFPSIAAWTIYNEGWSQRDVEPAPEGHLYDVVKKLDSTRLINAVSGWNDHGFGDFRDNHHYANPQCGTPFYSLPSGPHDSGRIGFQGEFGGVGHNVSIENLWNVKQAIDAIAETYEINDNLEVYNYRSHVVMDELRQQIEMFECSGGVWTQTTDVEGEVNGLLTYDRRVLRADKKQWRDDIQSFYDAAAKRGGVNSSELRKRRSGKQVV